MQTNYVDFPATNPDQYKHQSAAVERQFECPNARPKSTATGRLEFACEQCEQSIWAIREQWGVEFVVKLGR